MATREFDPLRLDVESFARAAAQLEGTWPLASLPRLQSLLAAPASGDVAWRCAGELRPSVGNDEIWLRLRADAAVALVCQRCLEPVEVPLAIDRRLRFVRDEASAEALDAQLDDDVLALTRALDVRALVEDELLLALPLVPRHDRCPGGVWRAASDATDAPATPFAALASLRKRAGGGDRGSEGN